MANIVFNNKKNIKPMTQAQLTEAYGGKGIYDMSRLDGNHCSCEGNGEFVLLPANSKAVREGGKRYMVCQKCGEYSHL